MLESIVLQERLCVGNHIQVVALLDLQRLDLSPAVLQAGKLL